MCNLTTKRDSSTSRAALSSRSTTSACVYPLLRSVVNVGPNEMSWMPGTFPVRKGHSCHGCSELHAARAARQVRSHVSLLVWTTPARSTSCLPHSCIRSEATPLLSFRPRTFQRHEVGCRLRQGVSRCVRLELHQDNVLDWHLCKRSAR